MATNGWMQFGLYNVDHVDANVHGGVALAAEMERALEQLIIDGGIKSPPHTRRGWSARARYLDSTQAGRQAMAAAGIDVQRRRILDWMRGARPSAQNIEALDSAYWAVRAHNMMMLGGFKKYLKRNGRGTLIEIEPVIQTTVLPGRRRPLETRTLTLRHVWDTAVDALMAGNETTLRALWEDDIILDLGSDWAAYIYVSHVGISA